MMLPMRYLSWAFRILLFVLLFGFALVSDEFRASVDAHRDNLLREGHLALNGLNLW